MTVTLTDPDSGTSIELWNAQQSKASNEGPINVVAPYGKDSDQAVITSLENQEEVTLSGITTARRVAAQSEYSSDYLTALAQWVVKFMSFHNAGQGQGYDLEEIYRGRIVTGPVSSAGWQRNKGEKFQVTWQLTFKLGRAEMSTKSISPPSVSPHNSPTLGGTDLHEIESYREDKKQNIKIYPIAHADPQDNDALSQGGVKRNIVITGRIPGQISQKNTFDASMRNLIGDNQVHTLDPGFPGRGTTLDVEVQNFESTREAGMTRLGKYALSLIEGKP